VYINLYNPIPGPDRILQLVDPIGTHRRHHLTQGCNKAEVRLVHLMIEIMDAKGIPLHREVIFHWADSRQMATRNTSLNSSASQNVLAKKNLGCFIPKGKGYW